MSENNINEKRDFVAPPMDFALPPQQRYVEEVSPHKASTAILLAVFFGMFGMHDFYTRNVKKGFIKILLSLTGIGGFGTWIWGFVDAFNIHKKKYRDGEGRIIK